MTISRVNNPERNTISKLIAQIGETDQLFLTAPSPELAQQRALLRLQLSQHSHQKNEQLYFLTEAAALLELALLDIDEDAVLHTNLSVCLTEIYLAFYQATQEKRYLTICNQILKPLSQSDRAQVLINLARTSAASQHVALTKHWLSKLIKQHANEVKANFLDELSHHPEFQVLLQEDWFNQLLRPTLH